MAGSLISGQAIIYERSQGVVYARYRDPPHNKIPRWVVGGDPDAVAEAMGVVSYDKWKSIMLAAEKHPTIKKQLGKLLVLFHLVQDEV